GLDAKPLATELTAKIPAAAADPVDALAGLADIMSRSRRAIAGHEVQPPDARRLIDIAVTSAALIQARGSAWLEAKDQTAKQHLRVLGSLIDAAYGSGLLSERERTEAARMLAPLLNANSVTQADLAAGMRRVERVVEWAQQSANVAFAEVSGPWMFLLPQV